MTEQWQELKETIIEMRDNDGTCTQQEVCKFLASLMDLLEKQTQEPFMNKPCCVAHQVCHEDKVKVLDEIEQEFRAIYPKNYAGDIEADGCSCVFSLNKILEIIDKYKTESEE